MLTIAAPSLPLGVEIYSRQQVRGHNVANLDPLGILDADLSNEIPYEIQYQYVRCPFCISACLSLCVWMYGCTRAYQCVRVCVCVCFVCFRVYVAPAYQCVCVRARVHVPRCVCAATHRPSLCLRQLVYALDYALKCRFVSAPDLLGE